MGANPFIFNNVSVKKVAFEKRKGSIKIVLSDADYNILYKNTVDLNNKKALKQMLIDLKSKGFPYFNESSWF